MLNTLNQRYWVRILVWVCLCLDLRIFAAELNPRSQIALHLGFDNAYIQEPSLNRVDRISYKIGAHYNFWNYARAEMHYDLILEPSGQTETVKVTENIHSIYPLLTAYYPYYFRFFLSMGPVFLIRKATISYKDTSLKVSDNLLAGVLRAGLDYAFTDSVELSASFAYQQRFKDKKTDWLLGLLVFYYLP